MRINKKDIKRTYLICCYCEEERPCDYGLCCDENHFEEVIEMKDGKKHKAVDVKIINGNFERNADIFGEMLGKLTAPYLK